MTYDVIFVKIDLLVNPYPKGQVMNDKVVSEVVKTAMSLALMAFSAFMRIMADEVENTEPENDKFDSFLRVSLDHTNAMEKLEETMLMHRPEHLTVNGCIAILLDMSRVVEIEKETGHVLDLDIENSYLKIKDALDMTMSMVLERS